MSELFNVNHFIVCQVNPHVVPFMSEWNNRASLSSLIPISLRRLVSSEVRFRAHQLSAFGWMPKFMASVQRLLAQRYDGDITIVPQIRYSDYLRVVEVPQFRIAIQVSLHFLYLESVTRFHSVCN